MKDSNVLLKGLRCPWCHSEKLFFDFQMFITDPIGVKIACKQCFMRTPIGKNEKDAIDILKKTIHQKQKTTSFKATLIYNKKEG